jgi:phage baseplate assembly protein W
VTAIPHFRVPLALRTTGPAPNLFTGTPSGEIDTYRTAKGSTVTDDPAVYFGTAPGTKVVTANAKIQEGADSGNVIEVEAGVTYHVSARVLGNAGGELLYMLAGDETIGVKSQLITASKAWQLLELEYTPTLSGTTGFSVITQIKAGYTFWVDDLRFDGAAPSEFATVEQDSIEEIGDCVEAALRTPVGSRIDAPEYGVPDETFNQLGPNPSAEVYLAAVAAVEPRAHLVGEAEIEAMTERISIRSAP